MAVDATCCRIMQIDPLKLRYLQLALSQAGSHIMEAKIHQIGEPISP